MRRFAMLTFVLLVPLAGVRGQQPQYDVVIANGRVIDPESRLDATRFVGIHDGKIQAISATPISGTQTIDAKGLVVAPGFIDLHAHGQNDENYRVFALDGVTTASSSRWARKTSRPSTRVEKGRRSSTTVRRPVTFEHACS